VDSYKIHQQLDPDPIEIRAEYRGDFMRAAGCGIGAGGPKNKYLPICVISPAFLPQNPT
jgi:hypothetical protein